MKTTLRTLAATGACTALAAGLAACGGSEGGGGTTLRLALNQSEDHPSFIALDQFGDDLSEATEGRWNIEVYPNEQLGAQAESMQLVGDGSVEMAIVSGPQLENLSSGFTVFNLPTVFDSIDHQMSVVNDGPQEVQDLYASLEDSNQITVVGGLTQGERSTYTRDEPAETPADLNGKSIRIQESELFSTVVQAMGGSPTPMAYGEVYTGLQSGVIDGAENNEVSYFTQKHYEVAPYFSYTRHLIGIDYLIGNTGTLGGMDEEDAATFAQLWNETAAHHTELWEQATQDAIEGAEAGGAEFVEVDQEAFHDAVAPLVDEFVVDDEQRAIYDAARGAAQG